MDDSYKIEVCSPFYLAMSHGWDGVGFLLQSMKQDRFEALVGCLKAQKYGKFLDLLAGMPQEIFKQVDKKGRNLLLIMVRYLNDLKTGSQELKKVQEVINILTRPV